MQIIVAKSAGFCFGVKRAIEIASKFDVNKNGKVFTLGPLIHNHQVVDRLAAKGIQPVEDLEEIKEGKVIVRSHGVGPKTLDYLKERGIETVDATCPFVKKAQRIAWKLQNEGFQVVILGDLEHPEVQGIMEWAGGKSIVVKDLEEAAELPFYPQIGLLAQTTQQVETLEKVASIIEKKCSKLAVFNTVCSATKVRQEEAFQLSREVDLMLVVGGRHSANTNKLASICRRAGTPVYHIEDAGELDPLWFNNAFRVGVTAGASTPDWIIEEVVQRMTGLSEEKMKNLEEVPEEQTSENVEALETSGQVLEEAQKEQASANGEEVEAAEPVPVGVPEEQPSISMEENEASIKPDKEEKTEEVDLSIAGKLQELHKGDIVEGVVVQIKDNEVMVDVGGKSEGIIPISEISHRPVENPKDLLQVGDKIHVYVLRVENEEGHPILSKKRADRQLAWEKLENSLATGEELRAPVIEVVKGGLLVDVGVRGFVPASLVERGYVEDLNQYLGKELRLRVIELDRGKNKAVLSQKAILDEEYQQLREKTWNTLEVGQVINGIVRRLTNFGAFVDIGGIDGLLHVSELSWGRVEHPRDVLSEGEEIKVKVLGIDREAEKVSLGLKQLLPNPWDTAEERYAVGSIVEGKVLRIAPFGAFVEVEPGIEGLVHISQLADYHVAKTEDVVSVGDVIPVKVLSVDQTSHRMSLSLREARGKHEVQETPKIAQEEENNSGVTLGDLFGELFEEEK
ncbi:MAG: bifunctional 4-hydroxy-3-methylbut-2-enyl diphosphate reductase/30S ribosomal protein S1 [Clostridia bacterium]|nr:bifunctional 4-hydroxy-3-methylbut-2-enyl diphosphate reductase/30S ribosomal protein S1 [Clostridia bacterium]